MKRFNRTTGKSIAAAAASVLPLLITISGIVEIVAGREVDPSGAWARTIIGGMLSAAGMIIFIGFAFFPDKKDFGGFAASLVILGMVHVGLLLLLPVLSLMSIYRPELRGPIIDLLGTDAPLTAVYIAAIPCMFLVLGNSFSIANFYINRAIDALQENSRTTTDYLLMILSPVTWFAAVNHFRPNLLGTEFIEFGISMVATQHMVSYFFYGTSSLKRWRAGDASIAFGVLEPVFCFASSIILFAASAGLYAGYVMMEDSLFWRMFFNLSLASAFVGSIRFFGAHADGLWRARREMIG